MLEQIANALEIEPYKLFNNPIKLLINILNRIKQF